MSEACHNESVANIVRPQGSSPLLLICEHASNAIPAEFDQLGLSQNRLDSHIAFDPGALELAKRLSELLDATLIYSGASRLLFDCNRPPEASDAMPSRSEVFDIAGNANLSAEQKQERVARFYLPFRDLLATTIENRRDIEGIVTVHSFTPVYKGVKRAVELGVLHDSDARFADQVLAAAASYTHLLTKRNQPYGPDDGVTHTLQVHGIANKLHNVMLELRNDKLSDCDRLEVIAGEISQLLSAAFEHCCGSRSNTGARV